MLDYLSITPEQQEKMTEMFSEWIDWFMSRSELDPNEPIFEDKEIPFTVSDYVNDVKKTFGFQNPCKESLSLALVYGGKDAVMTVIRNTAPLVIKAFPTDMISRVVQMQH